MKKESSTDMGMQNFEGNKDKQFNHLRKLMQKN